MNRPAQTLRDVGRVVRALTRLDPVEESLVHEGGAKGRDRFDQLRCPRRVGFRVLGLPGLQTRDPNAVAADFRYVLEEAAGEIEQRVAHPGVPPVEQHEAVVTETPIPRMEVATDECFGQAAGVERVKSARKIREK